jgi:integrase
MGCYSKGNRWYIDYYVNGKRKREVVTIPEKDPATITIRDAEKALAIRKSEIAQGKFDIINTQKQIKFEVLLNDYLEWAKENHRSYDRDITISKNLFSFFKDKSISDIKLWDIEKYKSLRKKVGRQPETINRELTVLRRMFKLAEKGVLKHNINKNPIDGMQLLKIPQKKYHTLSELEFNMLYEASAQHLKPILLCAYSTGMRRGEIQKLKWSEVDLDEGYIHVIESKNDEWRSIPIGSVLIEVLKELISDSTSHYVFTTQDGKPFISKKSWDGAFKNALRRSAIEKCTFHELRHTFVSNLIVKEKEDSATVMAISGHKDIRMLQRYSHTNEDAKREAIRKLNLRIMSNEKVVVLGKV